LKAVSGNIAFDIAGRISSGSEFAAKIMKAAFLVCRVVVV